MKQFAKRGLSLVLALVLLVSLLPGLPLQSSAASYTYNWGYRGVTATSLSTAAVNFYANNNTSYEQMSSYTGAASVGSVPGSSLYSYLQTLMSSNHSHITKYDETKELYRYTDCEGGGGTISSFYSGRAIGPDWDGAWNREHTWPNSKGEGNAENDIMMLRPTSTIENSSRGNTAYGASGGYYDPNAESGYTLNLHGDVARIMLYVYVRWGNTSYMWGSSGVMESKEVLLAWMAEDPVDTWELGRNDAVQSITGTRNVFVDYPELAFLLFDEVVPATMTTPSGMAGASAYKITAASNDTAMGTVSVSGKNIQAVPADGHMVSGYELVSGTADVTRKGNTFVVNATSDCEIKVIFAPKVLVNLSYLSNGLTLSSQEVYSSDPVTLASYTGTEPEGCKFLGWVDAPVESTETRPSFYRPGESYTVNGATKLHALFSYTAEGGVSGGTWSLVTSISQLCAGDQVVITCNSKNVVAGALEKTYLKEVPVTFSDDKSTIPTMAADASVFTLGGTTGAWTFTDASGNTLGCYEVKKLAYDYGTTTWNLTMDGGNVKMESNGSGNGWMQFNAGSPRFTTYTSSQQMPQLYVLDTASGSTFYTTSTCAHNDTVDVDEEAADCTSGGYTAGVYCNDCESYISGHEVIPAYGHNYVTQVTPPTVTEAGYTTHTCDRCGDVYTSDPVPALGETYTVSFSVPMDAKKIEDMGCNTTGILLPEASQLEGYTFLGWTTESLEDTTEKPVVWNAGDKYVATANTTLYALYTYTVGGTGAGGYVLVTDADQLEVGTNVVIASANDNVALSTTQNTNNRGQAPITKSGTGITFDASAGVAVLELREGAVAGTYAFYCPVKSGYLYAASSSSNQLKTKAALDANGSFLIEVTEDGVATVKAQGDKTRNWMRYNKTSSLFACYGSGQNDISLYVEAPAGDTYYTTEIAHRHVGSYHAAADATCTAPGNVEYWFCHCGMAFADSNCTEILYNVTLPKLDHTFTKEVAEEAYLKAEATCAQAAQYALSCENCGAASEEGVFFHGDKDSENHVGGEEVKNASDATCEADGYTGDTHCLECGEKLLDGEVIPGGHTVENGICTRCEVYGICGDNLTWTYENGILTISGTGDMYLYGGNDDVKPCPWADYRTTITKVVIEDGVTSLGRDSFKDCSSLTEVRIPETVEDLGYYGTFRNCTSLTSFTVPAGITIIPNYAFAGCTNLTNITIPEGVTGIYTAAFQNCENLQDITLPESLTHISNYVFDGCSSLRDVQIPESVSYIGDNAFCGCASITSIVIPEGISKIDVATFYACSSLESIVIPESVTYIGQYAFVNCGKLAQVTIPDNVTYIGTYAFTGCKSISEITIPDGITAIAEGTFQNCAIKEIVIPANVESVDKYAFAGCSALSKITFEGDAPKFYGVNIFAGVTATAYYSPDATWTEDVMQNYGGTITWVARGSGTCGENLTWTFENGTLTISGEGEMYDYSTEANPENAPWAYYLEEMEAIVMEEGITSIGHQAFAQMIAVKEVSLPETLTTIGDSAFFNCVALEEMVIPASVTEIGDSAFTFCFGLKDITFNGSAPALGTDAFGGVNATVNYSPDASWTADVLQNYGGTITWAPDVIYVVTVNGVGYESFADALMAAQPGDVLKLLEDVVVEDYLVIPNGVSLDLGDHSLTAQYLFASKDSQVYGNADSGKLMVEKGNLALGQKGYSPAEGQYLLPVWDEAQNGYIFCLFIVDTDAAKGRGLKIDEAAGTLYFQFKHRATSAINTRLFADGATDNEMSVIIRLSWTNDQGTAYQDFVYNDAQVGKVTGNFDYTFTLTGYSALNINLSTLQVQAMVVTNSGATAFSTIWTQANAR